MAITFVQRSYPWHLTLAAGLCLWARVWAADPPATQPASNTRPAETATGPAPSSGQTDLPHPRAEDPRVDAILDRLEAKGVAVDSIEAGIEFIKIDPILEDRQEYTGTLKFKQARPNPRFLIQFDRFKQDRRVVDKKQWHAFDGRWYIEARESTRTITRREVVRPGEHVEVFRLGHGPFPLPFGQKKAEILHHFEVRLIPPGPGDPPETDHLECRPRPTSELSRRYDAVHFHIDRNLSLPVRVETLDKEEGNRIMAAFHNIRVNTGLVESQLDLPELKGYETDVIPLPPPDPSGKEGG